METLRGDQIRQLRRLAHSLRPVVQVGKQGVTEAVVHSVEQAIEANELIKVKFIDHKDEKQALCAEIAARTSSVLVGVLGNIATFYRRQADDEKRKIELAP